MPHEFPELSFFLDASGRFSADKDLPIVIGGVAVETSKVDSLRESLLAVTKGGPIFKWSSAENDVDSAKAIFHLMVMRQITGVVTIVRKGSTEWDRYWETGQKLYEKGVKKLQEALPYAKPATTLKFHLYCIAIGQLLGFHLFRNKHLLPRDRLQPQGLAITAICDSDIQGESNTQVFKRIFHELGELPNTQAITNMIPKFDVRLMTEQQELLLALPDYLAGYVYSVDVYGCEKDSARRLLIEEAKKLVDRWPNTALKITDETFKENYLVEPHVFDRVLPKGEREQLIEELKAQGVLPPDWKPGQDDPGRRF